MIDVVALVVFILLFIGVTVLGFYAARWNRADLNNLNEWGLGGRRFGTIIVWFLLGGDLYTAYTFIAVPALMFGAGAVGFFAVPYTIMIYPMAMVVLPRLWAVCHRHNWITPADFVHGRYGSRALELAVALTGILATMPYIALQLVGIQVVLQTMGITGTGFMADVPLIIAFIILAAYTYTSGLRAPAMIAVVKDTLIYITVIVAVIAIPMKLGGFGHVFTAAQTALAAHPKPGSILISPAGFPAYATLAFGSALALFLYPHSVTGVLSSRNGDVIRRNAAFLPAYSLVLGLIALLGYMALAAGITSKTTSLAVPLLFKAMFPSWFVGVAFAAIAIGALVPAAIMSIAAANLFTRNVWVRYLHPRATPAEESNIARLVSLIVKLGALAFIIFIPLAFAINLQLLGGVWILQTLPAIVFGLYTRWFHARALFVGWLVGMIAGTAMAASQGFTSVYPLHIFGAVWPAYAAIYALVLNLAVSAILTPVLDAMKVRRADDAVRPGEFEDRGLDAVPLDAPPMHA
ncbi:MAG TPA: sodium:solute symporter [Candidatus Baltobacteraceae bacterium]|nr:sodium:solute symporter [Candidatus Baltobacteraceae bacterium]